VEYGVFLAWFGVAVGCSWWLSESSIALAIKLRVVNVHPLLMAVSASVLRCML